MADSFDNCLYVHSGPAELSKQVDSDMDGYGNACDADYDGNASTTAMDYEEALPTS